LRNENENVKKETGVVKIKATQTVVILLAAFSVSLFRLFPVEFGSLLLYIELAGFTFSYLLGLYFFKSTPFKVVPYIVLGAFIGIVLDIIVFPNINGFERNLFPIEIVIHVLIATATGYGLALICYFLLKLQKRSSLRRTQ
jgi:hypothetical protein